MLERWREESCIVEDESCKELLRSLQSGRDIIAGNMHMSIRLLKVHDFVTFFIILSHVY